MINNVVPQSAAIFDDHRMFAESFSMSLERLGFFETVTTLTDEKDVFQFFRTKRSGNCYFFVDYFIPNVNVIHLISDIRKLSPSVKIIIISSLTNPLAIQKLLAQKLQAFVSKASGIADLADCMHAIQNNRFYVSSNILSVIQNAQQETGHFEELTTRETEILKYIFQGRNIAETADLMNLSRHTVATHRRNMMAKTKSKSVTELIAHASSRGLVPTDA